VNIGVSTVTHPIALCAYVVSAVCWLAYKKWKPESRARGHRLLFYLTASVSAAALVGGLCLAYLRVSEAARPAVGAPSQSMKIGKIEQKVDNGAAVAGVQGDVTVEKPAPGSKDTKAKH
jgi:hypothetical protein